MVESYEGKTPNDTMFTNLKKICESLLTTGKIPHQYLQTFNIKGKKERIASIGKMFDDGIRPIIGKKSIKKKQNQMRRSETRGGSRGGSRSTQRSTTRDGSINK